MCFLCHLHHLIMMKAGMMSNESVKQMIFSYCFKGVTLETDGVVRFPDAPTERGIKHLNELAESVKQGFEAYVLFVIQMADVKYLHPNDATDPAFSAALREAAANGVQVLAMDCAVTEDSMALRLPVLVKL